MCGLLGYWSKKSLSIEQFKNHLNKIHHRGPDHNGVKVINNLMLGHNRLAIIDTDSKSDQPMTSDCEKITVVFNGEIYNYIELRKELYDYPYNTNSDTEVIIAAYLAWGEKFVERLKGMFSIAIHDLRFDTLFLVRDPIGKKPLYYSHGPNYFAFASEIKSLIGLPEVGNEIDSMAANQYFSMGYIGGHKTVFQDISQLQAGHSAVYSLKSGLKIQRYWQLPVTCGDMNMSEAELIDELDSLLIDAIKIRLRSDVPLGAFLSGGLDSSLIVAIAANLSSTPINTFTVSFPGMPNDESDYARKIASHFGTHHTMYEVNEDMLDCLPNLISQLDQPFADSSFIPMNFICKEARRNVTVALSGDGGDELFAGYGHYNAFSWENRVRQHWPPLIRKGVGYIAGVLPERHRTRTLKRLIFDDQYESIGAYASRFFSFKEREELFNESIQTFSQPEVQFQSHFVDEIDWLQNICQADFQDYMVDDILVKVDRMSMLNSLEVRSPLLDQRIAEFAFTKVPSKLKFKNGVQKYLLKQLARRYLPKDFSYERKAGFGVPLGSWFNSTLGDRLSELLSSSPSGCVNRDVVTHYLKAHRRGLSNYSKKLFAILVWEEWFAAHMGVE